MKNGEGPQVPEHDLLRLYTWVMLGLTVVLAGALWWQWSQVGKLRKSVTKGENLLDDYAEAKLEIKALLKVYGDNNEEAARYEPYTWFSEIWQRKGIPDASVNMRSWQNPRVDAKGGYLEERIEIGIQPREPLKREQVGIFCHEIERASTRLRILDLKIDRKGANFKKGVYDEDAWAGKFTVGYRRQRPKQ